MSSRDKEGLIVIQWDNLIGPLIKLKYPNISLSNNEVLNLYISHVISRNPVDFLTLEMNDKIFFSFYNRIRNEVLVLLLNFNVNIKQYKQLIIRKMNEIIKINDLKIDDLKREYINIKNSIGSPENEESFSRNSNLDPREAEIFKLKEEINELKDKYDTLIKLLKKTTEYFRLVENMRLDIEQLKKKFIENGYVIEKIF